MHRQSVNVHGHRVDYRTGGTGPVVLLIHGMAGSSVSWKPILSDLAHHVTYIAPDLPGHGRSDKPRGDYSLGAQAGFLRDFLDVLGHDSATVVGTSLGGGIAMQFAYQHPNRCERLVLVGSGGLGPEVSGLLRFLAAPGVDLVLPVACQPFIRTSVEKVGGWAGRVGFRPTPKTSEMWRAYTSLIDRDTRKAFNHTLRSVVDAKGQRVTALDRLYLTAGTPTMIIWGDQDPTIPVGHAHAAHQAIPDSRLEIMTGCGHFPHVEEPAEFAKLLVDFVGTTDAVLSS